MAFPMKTNSEITNLLAQRVMRWRLGPDRFLLGDRRWLARWRFQPMEKLDDAFQLLEKADPSEFLMRGDDEGNITVKVTIGGKSGRAVRKSKPEAISFAVAAAIGIDKEND